MYDRVTKADEKKLQELITDNPLTYDEIVEASGFNKVQIMRWVKRSKDNIHVAGWAKDVRGRVIVPRFAWGNGEDTPRTGLCQSDAQRARAYRQRVRERKQEVLK